jgi:hypothetical protein
MKRVAINNKVSRINDDGHFRNSVVSDVPGEVTASNRQNYTSKHMMVV